MIAYKNAMNNVNHLKEPKPILEKEHNITKYPLHKIINYDNKTIAYPKHNMNYLIENTKNFIRKYIENKDVTNYTNEIKKLNSLDIKLKHNDKPPEYYQYNMKNKTMADFRLDAYQNENNIKSYMTILQEENSSDKTINEIKTDEDDFQFNLNLILNEYKNKQQDFNTTKNEIDDNYLKMKTDNINIKLDELTTDYKKLPVVYKTYTKPISEDEKIEKMIKSLLDNNKILNNEY